MTAEDEKARRVATITGVGVEPVAIGNVAVAADEHGCAVIFVRDLYAPNADGSMTKQPGAAQAVQLSWPTVARLQAALADVMERRQAAIAEASKPAAEAARPN